MRNIGRDGYTELTGLAGELSRDVTGTQAGLAFTPTHALQQTDGQVLETLHFARKSSVPPEARQRVGHERAHSPAVGSRDQVLSREGQVRPRAEVSAGPVHHERDP